MPSPKEKEPSRRPARAKKAAPARTDTAAGASGERFPPLSTSLDTLLVDGSDGKFRNLIYKVLSTSTLMLRSRDRFAAHIGVSGPQYSMMVAIGEAGSATVGQIADELRVSSPFVTAEIGKLIERGIVERRPNQRDRRSSLLTLTEKGRDMIVDVGPLRRLTNDLVFGSLTSEEVQSLHAIMDKLVVDAEHALHTINSPALSERKK
ncbi:MarR family winged helix-turn-helix transcriptional regulator [Propylenella binzhouense]|uniref:MarR family transcriptional regulator n=1 Tax=Propylenella binzhouense TaxID=2555902 RepID=A0A964T343_9HYPH|nr:MarR family winged helix-turn-helix transcriptional regulator [Propylenella binzhouense]MYZ47581.1 MarR family transcriptional regulator [Propylenella binzhouense]